MLALDGSEGLNRCRRFVRWRSVDYLRFFGVLSIEQDRDASWAFSSERYAGCGIVCPGLRMAYRGESRDSSKSKVAKLGIMDGRVWRSLVPFSCLLPASR